MSNDYYKGYAAVNSKGTQLEIDGNEIEMTSDISDDLGADRLDMVDIAMTVEDEYSIELPDEALENIKRVEDLVEFIETNLE